MASKRKSIDPIGRMPELGVGSHAMVDFIASTPYLCDTAPLHVLDGEAPNPSEHPRKVNPGKVHYFGDA